MALSGGQTETVRGRVEQTNEKGLKVDGRWFNWSQYSRASVRPQEGDDVELEIARGKFINDAHIVDGAQGLETLALDDSFTDSAPAPRAATASRVTAAAPVVSATPNADRNTEIRRLALIKAAADYAATRAMEPDEVITLAARWERWVVDRE